MIFIFFIPSQLDCPQIMESRFLPTPCHLHPCFVPSLIAAACLWLVVAWKYFKWRPSKATTYNFLFFFVDQCTAPNEKIMPPRTFRPSLASSSIHLLPHMLTSIWLLNIFMKCGHLRPTPPPYLSTFWCGFKIIPNKGTSRRKHKPSAGHLQQIHMEWRRNDFGVPLPYPWKESNAAG